MPLCDTLLRLAEQRLFNPHWSLRTLHELERTLILRRGVPASHAARRVRTMQSAFSAALAEYSSAESPVLPDPNDEHVLAAAIGVGAQAIVTFNLRHFPATICGPLGIDVLHPDDFLVMQFRDHRRIVIQVVVQQILDIGNPPIGLDEVLHAFRRQPPRFASLLELPLRAELEG
jgi:predicted nucleic acid-binding protein